MPFLFSRSAFIKEQICVKSYLEATCETVENTFQKRAQLRASADSARQGAPAPRGMNMKEQNSLLG